MAEGPSGDGSERPGGLKRSMGPIGAFFITLSVVSPSIAVFVVGSDVIRQVGTGVFLCFSAAAVFGVAMSCVYGELGSAFPGSGGEYTILGRVMGPHWANGVLGLNLLGFSISLALSGFGVATYLGAVFPALPTRPLPALIVLMVAGIATLQINVGATVTGAVLLVELIALVALTVLGLQHIHQPLSALLHPVVANAIGGLRPPHLAELGAATAAGIYAFNGYGAAIFFGEDMRAARNHMAPVVLLALAAGVVVVMPPIAAVVLGAPNLHALSVAPAPVSAFIEQTSGHGVAQVMSLGVALAIFNTMIAIALMAGRQLYATARNDLWPRPVSTTLSAVHRRWGSPWVATLVMGTSGLLACLLDPHTLVLTLGNSNIVTYAALCLAALQGRRTGKSGRDAWRMPAFPAPPVLGLLFLLAVMVFDVIDPAGRTGLLVTAVTFGASQLALARR